MPGVVGDEALSEALRGATIGLVTQRHDGTESNLPSKIMNYMAVGLPIVAAVNPAGEVARLLDVSGAGWVADSADPDSLPRTIAAALDDPEQLERGAEAGSTALEHFSLRAFGDQLDRLLEGVV